MIQTGQEAGENTPNRAEIVPENTPILPPIDSGILKWWVRIAVIVIMIDKLLGKEKSTPYNIARQYNTMHSGGINRIKESDVELILFEYHQNQILVAYRDYEKSLLPGQFMPLLPFHPKSEKE